MKEDNLVKDIDLKTYIKNLISGKANILDLFDKNKIKSLVFSEVKSSVKIAASILVLALLSSIIKSYTFDCHGANIVVFRYLSKLLNRKNNN